MIYTILSFSILALYILFAVVRYGFQWSISQTYHMINYKWVFCVVMAVSSALLWPAISEHMNGMEWAAFLTCGCGMAIGFCPDTNDKGESAVHTAFAVVCGVCSQVCVLVTAWECLLFWVVFVPLIIAHKKSRLFWIEVACFSTLYLSLFKN